MNADCQRAVLNMDAELSATEISWQEKHLAACDTCRAEAAVRERVRTGLRRAVRATPVDVAFEQRIRSGLRTPGFRRQWQPFAAAAVVLIAIGSYFLAPIVSNRMQESAYFRELPGSVSRIMRVGLSDHIHCAAFRKFRQPPVAADLPVPFRPVLQHVPPGYRVRAAHECKAQGRNFVHLVLQSPEEKTVSLVMVRKENGETFANSSLRRVMGSLPVFTEDVPRYRIAGFEASAYLVFVVSDMTSGENQQLAQTLAAPVLALLNTIG